LDFARDDTDDIDDIKEETTADCWNRVGGPSRPNPWLHQRFPGKGFTLFFTPVT